MNIIHGMHFSKTSNPGLNFAIWGVLYITFLLLSKPSCQHSDYPPIFALNPRLSKAYGALQAWKLAITSDPQNFTSNWCGPNVCNYTGIYCAPAPDEPHTLTVAGIDLNHANMSGNLPEELGLLKDLAFFHINSNRFCGKIPDSFQNMHLLYELDLSNNRFSSHQFPPVLLSLPSLKFLDIRFNQFKGVIPPALFDLKLDALFINNNEFRSSLPQNFGNSPVSVLVLANNHLNGCIPSSLAKMSRTLNEIILLNSGLTGCLQQEIELLKELTVFDVSSNSLVGPLPDSIGGMKKLEKLSIAHNNLSGDIPESISLLPKLQNFTYSYNYFSVEPPIFFKLPAVDDMTNCIAGRLLQRSPEECKSFNAHAVDCGSFDCSPRISYPPPPALAPRSTIT